MTNATQQKSEAVRSGEAATQKVAEAMQQGLAAWMAVPQRLMQANVETITESVNFMNRRMKMQAAMFSGLGQLANGVSVAETHKHLIETMTRELAAEAQEVGELARKNLETMMHLIGAGSGSAGRSS